MYRHVNYKFHYQPHKLSTSLSSLTSIDTNLSDPLCADSSRQRSRRGSRSLHYEPRPARHRRLRGPRGVDEWYSTDPGHDNDIEYPFTLLSSSVYLITKVDLHSTFNIFFKVLIRKKFNLFVKLTFFDYLKILFMWCLQMHIHLQVRITSSQLPFASVLVCLRPRSRL